MLIPGQVVYLVTTDPTWQTNQFFLPMVITTRVGDGTVDVKQGRKSKCGLPLRLASDPAPAGEYCELVS
jgi:hypothetical protein